VRRQARFNWASVGSANPAPRQWPLIVTSLIIVVVAAVAVVAPAVSIRAVAGGPGVAVIPIAKAVAWPGVVVGERSRTLRRATRDVEDDRGTTAAADARGADGVLPQCKRRGSVMLVVKFPLPSFVADVNTVPSTASSPARSPRSPCR
jgi:hypothetical protein